MAKGPETNRHHIMTTRSDWQSNPNAKRVRNTHELIPLMDIEVHEELTKNCPVVPLLGYKALQLVVAEFRPTGETLSTLDKLLMAINEVCSNPNIHYLERQLGQLAMDSLEIQIPYLKDGIIR